MSISFRFLIIDDDDLNNTLCKLSINSVIKNCEINSFTNPLKGLEFIASESNPHFNTILFLDLYMPQMTGLEFLTEFDKLPGEVKNSYKIYIISSSIDPKDREAALSHEHIIDYFIKPLNDKLILSVASSA